jgi:hypothetical protein
MVPNTPKGAREFKSLTEKQLTRKSNCPSIKGTHPIQKDKAGIQKLALNIVHAVEFSRNGRTQVHDSPGRIDQPELFRSRPVIQRTVPDASNPDEARSSEVRDCSAA